MIQINQKEENPILVPEMDTNHFVQQANIDIDLLRRLTNSIGAALNGEGNGGSQYTATEMPGQQIKKQNNSKSKKKIKGEE